MIPWIELEHMSIPIVVTEEKKRVSFDWLQRAI